ncbi:MAG: hypothetical protein BroJett039_02490 [Chloroflexota bacterium]|nr:MAG: hypothetical protein BroJett039_02490 [Chloroflexota bacterium]
MSPRKKIVVKWFLSLALVAFIALVFAPRAEITPARAAWAKALPSPTITPLAPPLVFVPLEQLNPFPTLSAANTTRVPRALSYVHARPHFPKPDARQVAPDSPISLLFDARMERASVETRFHVARADNGAAVDGYFEWHNKLLLFYPVPLLENNVAYRVVLEPGARSLTKPDTILEPVEWKFSTGELSLPQS